MRGGKSQAAVIHAKLLCEFNPEKCIAITSKDIYNRLIAEGFSEDNLIKTWEPVDNNILVWYDELYDSERLSDSYKILKGRE